MKTFDVIIVVACLMLDPKEGQLQRKEINVKMSYNEAD